MNAPARIMPTLASPPYDGDTYGWALQQAELLKARRFSEIDLQNIIEEIETVGRSERGSLRSNLYQVALHLMKWDAQPERRGNSWWHSIQNHRDAAEQVLSENPSLKPELAEITARAVADARRRAQRETELPAAVFASIDYNYDTLIDRPVERPERS